MSCGGILKQGAEETEPEHSRGRFVVPGCLGAVKDVVRPSFTAVTPVRQSSDPRAPNAPMTAGAAFGETLLASDPARAATVGPVISMPSDPRGTKPSLAEKLRSLPVAIQGLWVGLVCIVLLVSSAAALRSLFAGNVGAAQAKPLPVLPTAPAATSTAPSVAISASATAPVPAAPGTLSIGGGGGGGTGAFGALAIRDRLPAHVRLRKIGAFLDDLERLLALDPTAIDRFDVRKLIADAAVFGMTAGPDGKLNPDGQRLFTFLTTKAGSVGPDILFELVTTRGGSRAATYAEEAMRDKALRDKGTPAFRIAYDLRAAATCQDRLALLDRVKAEADRRVLATLFQMARCGHGPSDCCLATDPAYKEAVRVINAKK